MLSLKLDGFKGIEDRLDKLTEKATKGVNDAMDASVMKINTEQVARSPVNFGKLSANNKFDISKPLYKVLENNTEYGPYMEFGTGTHVFENEGWVDEELMAIAAQFKGKGIRQVNIHPHPFFFPPFLEEKPRLLQAIKDLLK